MELLKKLKKYSTENHLNTRFSRYWLSSFADKIYNHMKRSHSAAHLNIPIHLSSILSQVVWTHADGGYPYERSIKELKEILKILETIKPEDFYYGKNSCIPVTMDDFRKANKYIFNEDTLSPLLTAMRYCGYQSKKIVQLLVDAGIYKYGIGEWGNRNFTREIVHYMPDEDIIWFSVYLRYKLVPECYQDYGCRTDKTFVQKMRMFHFFHQALCIELDFPHWNWHWPDGVEIIECCLMFSENLDEIKSYIGWFLPRYRLSTQQISLESFKTALLEIFNKEFVKLSFKSREDLKTWILFRLFPDSLLIVFADDSPAITEPDDLSL